LPIRCCKFPDKTKVDNLFGGFFLKDGAACGMTASINAQTHKAGADESGKNRYW
jgi:hypothetical protein